MDPIYIKEVLRPADQGRSRPYICRGEDDELYYVKGRNTTADSMYKEWVCAHLARGFGLPIPDFTLVEIPPELVAVLPPDFTNIGSGPAFGSKAVPEILWFEPAAIASVSAELQKRIVAFDWWIQNTDRSQYNSNLLLQHDQLVVIDHNNAMDTDFDPLQFAKDHIFADEAKQLFGDFLLLDEYQKRFQKLTPEFKRAMNAAPECWKWYDLEATVPSNFDADHAESIINLCNNNDFWNTP